MCVCVLCIVDNDIFLEKIAMIFMWVAQWSSREGREEMDSKTRRERGEWRRRKPVERVREKHNAMFEKIISHSARERSKELTSGFISSPSQHYADVGFFALLLACFFPIEIANYLILDFAFSTVPWWASVSFFFAQLLPLQLFLLPSFSPFIQIDLWKRRCEWRRRSNM